MDFSGIPGQTLTGQLETTDLNEIRPAISLPDDLRSGAISFTGTVAGALDDPRIAGHAIVRNAVFRDRKIDSLSGDFKAANSGVTIAAATLVTPELQAQGSGSLAMTRWRPTDKSAVTAGLIANGDVTKLLALGGWKNAQVSGTLSATTQVTGTVGDPHVTADLTLAKGQVYGEPFDSVTGRARYQNGGTEVLTALIAAGTKRVNLSVEYQAGQAATAKATFSVSTNVVSLNQFAVVRDREPDLRGDGPGYGERRVRDPAAGRAAAIDSARPERGSHGDVACAGIARLRRCASDGPPPKAALLPHTWFQTPRKLPFRATGRFALPALILSKRRSLFPTSP